jgi:hypothetical protein
MCSCRATSTETRAGFLIRFSMPRLRFDQSVALRGDYFMYFAQINPKTTVAARRNSRKYSAKLYRLVHMINDAFSSVQESSRLVSLKGYFGTGMCQTE